MDVPNQRPVRRLEEYRAWVAPGPGEDPLFFAIVDRARGQAVGVGAYLRIDAADGVVEVGHIAYSPRLQRTRGRDRGDVPDDAAGFDARLPALRVEVRCAQRAVAGGCRAPRVRVRGHLPPGDDVQGPQPRHGLVLGGRPGVAGAHAAFERWLDPANFDAAGSQRRSLGELRNSGQNSVGHPTQD